MTPGAPPGGVLPDPSSPAVVVLDDNLVLVKLVIQTLTPLGLQCLWARSEREARELLLTHAVDLLICDILPPHTDGISLGRWLRTRDDLKGVPILYFTSASDRDTIREAAAIGNVDYLLKPLRPAVFCERVLRLLERSASDPIT